MEQEIVKILREKKKEKGRERERERERGESLIVKLEVYFVFEIM